MDFFFAYLLKIIENLVLQIKSEWAVSKLKSARSQLYSNLIGSLPKVEPYPLEYYSNSIANTWIGRATGTRWRDRDQENTNKSQDPERNEPDVYHFNYLNRYYVEDTVIVQTIKNIKKGEEICENYGPTFYVKPRTERQAELSGRYWFQCNCQPCLQNWQLLEKLPTDADADQLKEVERLMGEGKLGESISKLSKILKKNRKNSRPSQTQVRAEDKLRTCIYNLGSFSVAEKK